MSQLRTKLANVGALTVTYKHVFYVEHPNYALSEQHDNAIEAALHAYLKQRFAVEAQSFARKYGEQLGAALNKMRRELEGKDFQLKVIGMNE